MARTRERDRLAVGVAAELGWSAVRVWECEVNDDAMGVAAQIMACPLSASAPRSEGECVAS
jgi:G:T-mismatch repair DNA endonuclease (very short patch repair protein)